MIFFLLHSYVLICKCSEIHHRQLIKNHLPLLYTPQELRSKEEELSRVQQEQQFREEDLAKRKQELDAREIELLGRELKIIITQNTPTPKKRKGKFSKSKLRVSSR